MRKIHIAGFLVRIGSLYRQRCAWCEEVLISGDLSCEMVATSDGSKPTGPSHYEIGALVEVEKEWADCPITASWVVPHKDGDQLPANACVGPPRLRLVKEEKDDGKGR